MAHVDYTFAFHDSDEIGGWRYDESASTPD